MTLFGIFITSFLIGFSGAASPGPLLTVTVTETIRKGKISAILLIVGHSLLEAIFLFGLLVGLKDFFKPDLVQGIIGFLGGIFLLWMGISIFLGAWKNTLILNLHDSNTELRYGALLEGIVVSLSNPFWTIWWVTVGASYLIFSLKTGVAGISSFYFGHILADFVWYGIIILALSAGRKYINQRYYRILLYVCGLFLLFLAAGIINFGIGKLL